MLHNLDQNHFQRTSGVASSGRWRTSFPPGQPWSDAT
jgi:hypothetical protein